ncbi:MAG: ATP-binding protein, partial [Cytophagales bacterium]|nr:ATP-binding protein [Cytophagales bacterium]
NAFKFTDENGEIVLTAESVSYKFHSIKFTVTDNGRGIPEKDLRNIFKRFFQADNQKKEEAGLGIGLALAKSLVELHLGEIHVSSK